MDTHGSDWTRTGMTAISGSKMLVFLAIGLCLVTGPGASRASAGSLSRSITITAQVRPYVKLTNIRQRSTFVISESDARRGYVEILAGSVIEIKSNNPNGCHLIVEVNGYPFNSLSLNIQGREITVPEHGGFIYLPPGNIVTPVNYLIALKPGTKPGVYPWPFRLTASL